MTETFKQPENSPNSQDSPSNSFGNNDPQIPSTQSGLGMTEEGMTEEGVSEEQNSDFSENMELSESASVSVTANSEVEEDWGEKSESWEEPSQSSPEVIMDVAPPESSISELEEVIVILQQDVASLKSQLDQQVQQTESFKGQYMRLAADFENFRRRTAKEKEELETKIKKNTVTELLGAIDSFERARSQIKPGSEGEMAIHKSYQGVYKQLVDGLKRLGVSAMRPEGEQFDPNYHEAVFREPTNEHSEGTVLEQLVRGYFLNDQVLRHAMVKVAMPKEEENEGDLETTQIASEDEEISLSA